MGYEHFKSFALKRAAASVAIIVSGIVITFGLAPKSFAEITSEQPSKSVSPDVPEIRDDPRAVDLQNVAFKPGKGIALQSNDGDFLLETRLRLQILASALRPDEDSAQMGLQLRRARLQFTGNVFGKHNKYKVELAFSPTDLRMESVDNGIVVRESPLLSWYFEWDKYRDFTVRVGQYKIPFSRQRVISSGKLEMVDRAIANNEFNLDRDIGLDIGSDDFLKLGKLRYNVGIYNGEGRSAFSDGDSNFLYLARLEYLPLGLFEDYSEGDLERKAIPRLSFGAAIGYARRAIGSRLNRRTPDDEGTTTIRTAVADATFKYQGLSLSSEFFWRDGERQPGNAVDENGLAVDEELARNGYGWFAQAGYLLPEVPMQFAGRYGEVRPLDESSLDLLREAGVAMSYYPGGHPFKVQADAFRFWRGDVAAGSTQIRVQLQISY